MTFARRRFTVGRIVGLALVAVVVMVAVGAATALAASPSASPSGGPVLKVGTSQDIDGMNPFVNYSWITWEAFHLNYDFLTWYDQNYRPTPDLATSWEHTPDGKVWTFHLRPNMKWSDGVPLTASDVAFTYNYILKNNLTFYMSYLQYVTKVEAPDPNTVVITSSRPNAMMLALYIPILPEHLWSKIDGSKVVNMDNVPMVGSGPYKIVTVKKGHYAELDINPYYWGTPPTVKKIFFDVYQSEDSLVEDYKLGNIDIADFTEPTSLRSVAGVAGSKTVAEPTIGFYFLGFNCMNAKNAKGNPLLKDVRIRQACAWAVDRQAITNAAMSGQAQVGTSVLSPAMGDWHWQPSADQTVTYNPDKAKQILDAAGYKTGPNGIRVAPNGQPLSFTLNALTDYQPTIVAAKLISQYLKNVGIQAKLDFMDQAAFNDKLYGNAGVDMYVWFWAGDIDPGYQLSAFTTDQILNNNDSTYSNPTYDQLFQQQATAVDRNQRTTIVHQMEQILYNDNPYVVLWYNPNLQAYRVDRWTGWQLAPPGAPVPVGNWLPYTYLSLKPLTGTTSSGGIGTSAIVAIVVAAVVVVGVVVWLVMRRKPKETEAA